MKFGHLPTAADGDDDDHQEGRRLGPFFCFVRCCFVPSMTILTRYRMAVIRYVFINCAAFNYSNHFHFIVVIAVAVRFLRIEIEVSSNGI